MTVFFSQVLLQAIPRPSGCVQLSFTPQCAEIKRLYDTGIVSKFILMKVGLKVSHYPLLSTTTTLIMCCRSRKWQSNSKSNRKQPSWKQDTGLVEKTLDMKDRRRNQRKQKCKVGQLQERPCLSNSNNIPIWTWLCQEDHHNQTRTLAPPRQQPAPSTCSSQRAILQKWLTVKPWGLGRGHGRGWGGSVW